MELMEIAATGLAAVAAVVIPEKEPSRCLQSQNVRDHEHRHTSLSVQLDTETKNRDSIEAKLKGEEQRARRDALAAGHPANTVHLEPLRLRLADAQQNVAALEHQVATAEIALKQVREAAPSDARIGKLDRDLEKALEAVQTHTAGLDKALENVRKAETTARKELGRTPGLGELHLWIDEMRGLVRKLDQKATPRPKTGEIVDWRYVS